MTTTATRRRSSLTCETVTELQRSAINFTHYVLRNALKKYPFLDDLLRGLEATTGLKKQYLLMILASAPFLLLVAILFAPFLISLPVSLYPLYMSFKAIERGKGDRTRWLIYWLLFNTVYVIEALFGFLLMLIPFYSLCRNCFFAWCMAPIDNNGSMVTYYMIRPFLKEPMDLADHFLDDASTKIQNVVDDNRHYLTSTAICYESDKNDVGMCTDAASQTKKLD